MRISTASGVLLLCYVAHAVEHRPLVPRVDPDIQYPFETFHTPATAHRVAIIGAGAGGSSAAFWLGKASKNLDVDFSIDVYEKQGYIGGRSTTVQPYGDASLRAVELGASIFVSANKNLWRATATEEWNLTRDNFDYEEGYDTGIWDGSQFLLVIGGSSGVAGWWETLKVIWRYGWTAPTRTQNIVKEMIDKFLTLYRPDAPSWTSMEQLTKKLQWTGLVSRTSAEYFDLSGVSKKFSREMIEAATRVNYGQNLDEIHALEGLCSLAATGASAVKGGNWQIFKRFLNESGAKVHLNSTVTRISPATSSLGWTVETKSDISGQRSEHYDSVVLAAPFHSTGIELPAPLNTSIPSQPYVHLHVTLLTTTAPFPNPAYFGLKPDEKVPQVILTTTASSASSRSQLEFNSLTYHGIITTREVHKPGRTVDWIPEYVVKIFSKERISDEWLERVFDYTGEPGGVGWVHRKEWDAYPRLPPTSTFPPVKLDDGFYYVNAFEPFISTMETETIAARNVVDMLVKDQLGLPGICGHIDRNDSLPVDGDYVLGWDC